MDIKQNAPAGDVLKNYPNRNILLKHLPFLVIFRN